MAPKEERKNPLMHLVAGGVAGVVESSCCHPLDTIKTRMQLRTKGGSTKGPIRTASSIVSKEGFFALYKGLSAVMMGIAPKMAVRFTSFETYKEWLGAAPAGNQGACVCSGRRSRFLMLVRDRPHTHSYIARANRAPRSASHSSVSRCRLLVVFHT